MLMITASYLKVHFKVHNLQTRSLLYFPHNPTSKLYPWVLGIIQNLTTSYLKLNLYTMQTDCTETVAMPFRDFNKAIELEQDVYFNRKTITLSNSK